MSFDPIVSPVLFGVSDGDNGDGANAGTFEQQFNYREISLADKVIKIRELEFHPLNANFVWPGNEAVAAWILEHRDLFENRRILELGSGTGVLSIFMKVSGAPK
mmetsp:Transcript_4785/g.7441  ORF Transcript_4785/g.7441 Transcript_4785/m.7441 type:complete len:104 (+) Transcript_4785:3-314(+)